MTTGMLLWLAAVVTACGVIARSHIGRLLRWLWWRNIASPLKAAFSRTIHETVGPLLDEVKAAARHQHDEQNGKLDTIKTTLAQHGQRLVLIEDHITRPRERT